MLNFDPERFLSIQTTAVSLASDVRGAIARSLAGGAENVFFLGAGGAGILMEPAYDLLRRSSSLPAYLEVAAELLANGSVALGPKSLVIIPSLSGTTAEALEVIAYVKDRGATVLSFTKDAESPVAQASDETFTVPAADDTSSESFYVQSLYVALAVLAERGEYADWDRATAELQKLPQALLAAKEQFEPRAAELAVELASGEDYHIITGAGSVWAEAYYYGMCILEEMQWIRTRPVHASDFFHGTLELVQKGVSVISFKGEDAARPLSERVEAFVPRVSDRLTVLDTADFPLEGLSDDVRALVSPAVLATILERLSAHLEQVRRHPLEVRRYYRRLTY
ncbi:SIS domain-containing protein [Microbacterium sp. 179-I 3D4 NHS]|uniref:SIS domain-containing protein n=1 Tax=Microbacterium sp. 179-I 3D4 NHS TaxID=3142381 RepID=UPI00399FB159